MTESAAKPPTVCANCGSDDIGRYCSVCGQENVASARPLRDMAHDLLEDLLRVDAKLWTTLAALARYPGRLTLEYLQGKRVLRVSPLKLFLSLVFLQVVLRSFAPGWFDQSALDSQSQALQRGAAILAGVLPARTPSPDATPQPAPGEEKHWEACQDVLRRQEKAEQERARKAWLTGNATTVALLRIPLYALLFAALTRRQKRFYAEHLIFTLHLQSAILLIETAGAVGAGLSLPLASFAATVGTLFYAFRACGTVYQEKRARTIVMVALFFLLGQIADGIAGVGAGIVYRLMPEG